MIENSYKIAKKIGETKNLYAIFLSFWKVFMLKKDPKLGIIHTDTHVCFQTVVFSLFFIRQTPLKLLVTIHTNIHPNRLMSWWISRNQPELGHTVHNSYTTSHYTYIISHRTLSTQFFVECNKWQPNIFIWWLGLFFFVLITFERCMPSVSQTSNTDQYFYLCSYKFVHRMYVSHF